MRLCLALGKTKRELLESTDSIELSEWWAYAKVYCLPDSFLGSAIVAHTYANLNSKNKKFSIEDFMPTRRRRKPMQSGETLSAKFAAFRARHGSKDG